MISCIFRILSLIFLLNPGVSLNGQIYSPAADNSRPTGPAYSRNDSIFIFLSTTSFPKKGSLTAIPVIPGTYTFEWSRYEPATGSFSQPFIEPNNAEQSRVTGLEEGGYRVRISDNSGTDTFFIAWIFINELRVEVTKSDQGKLKTDQYDCNEIRLKGQVQPDTFSYYEIDTQKRISL